MICMASLSASSQVNFLCASCKLAPCFIKFTIISWFLASKRGDSPLVFLVLMIMLQHVSLRRYWITLVLPVLLAKCKAVSSLDVFWVGFHLPLAISFLSSCTISLSVSRDISKRKWRSLCSVFLHLIISKGTWSSLSLALISVLSEIRSRHLTASYLWLQQAKCNGVQWSLLTTDGLHFLAMMRYSITTMWPLWLA